MGEKNDVFCAWLEKAEIFSDFMNGAMFAGKQISDSARSSSM